LSQVRNQRGFRFPRFYPILDTELLAARGLPVRTAARVLLEAGVGILQFRHKGQLTREVFEDAEMVGEMCRDAGARFIVNDRADVALLLDAGVHVGQDDLPPSDVRRVIGPSRMVGYSTHNEQQLRSATAEPVDYVAFGPVFATVSKRNPDPVAGLAELRRVRGLTDVPLIAIGGITRANAQQVLEAGADSIAVIGDLYPEPLDLASLGERAREWLALLAA
jgi:thiamine-phosphate pyrophosphorylase